MRLRASEGDPQVHSDLNSLRISGPGDVMPRQHRLYRVPCSLRDYLKSLLETTGRQPLSLHSQFDKYKNETLTYYHNPTRYSVIRVFAGFSDTPRAEKPEEHMAAVHDCLA